MRPVSARYRLAMCLGLGALPFVPLRRAFAAPDFEFRLSHSLATADAVHTAMTSLADALAKRSGGRIEVTVFPADQLGSQADVSEMVREGGAVLQLTDDLFLGRYVPDVSVLQAPYLLDKPDDFLKLMNTPWIEDLEKKLAAQGIRVISWTHYFGTRQMLSKRPIRSPKDLEGLNFRCAAAPMYVEMVKAMGARPITTSFAEVYTGLAQGALDLMEAPLPTMWASKFYEQTKYVSLTSHMVGWDPVVVSEAAYQAMPPDLQQMLHEEAAKSAALMTQLKRQQEAEILPQFRAAGLTVIEDVDRAAFRAVTAPVYDRYPGITPGIRAKMQAMLAA